MPMQSRIACRDCAFFVIISHRYRLRDLQLRLAMLLRRLPLFISGLFALGLAVSGCAAPGPAVAGAEVFNAPLEHTTRTISGVTQEIDKAVPLPAEKAYRGAVIPP